MDETSSGPIPLNYGRKSGWRSAFARGWGAFRAESARQAEARWSAIGHGLGTLVNAVGGPRRALLVFGMAFLAGGVGLALERWPGSMGPFWMWIGGGMIGLVIPLSGKKS